MNATIGLTSLFLLGLVVAVPRDVGAQSFTTTTRLHLRQEPTTRAATIRILGSGESVVQLSVDSVSSGFIWVRAGVDTGWVASSYLQSLRLGARNTNLLSLHEPATTGLESCPINGSAAAGSTDAISNALKRRVPPPGNIKTLTFADFARLQQDVGQVFGFDPRRRKLDLDEAERARLKGLPIMNGTVDETDLVQIAGYIIDPAPHANTGESVNCGLHGVENNDFHITIGARPNDTGFQGIVVEMIPQGRPTEWNLRTLQHLESAHALVLIVGQLFYDEKHLVNDNPQKVPPGQPQRFSLFEVHPITEIMVCNAPGRCDPASADGWVALSPQSQE